MKEITSIDEVLELSKENHLIIDFGASWCGPCRAMAPIFEKAAELYPNIIFVKCNTDNSPEIATKYNISTIPCLKFIKNNIEEMSIEGLIQLNVLESKINNFLNE